MPHPQPQTRGASSRWAHADAQYGAAQPRVVARGSRAPRGDAIVLTGRCSRPAPTRAQARISGSLQADGDDLLCALPCASHGAFLVVQDELASLRRENASSRRFRASRAHIIAQQAIAVHTDVQLQLEHLGKPTPHDVSAERAELEATCAELQGEAAAHGTAATDEADADGI